MEPFLVRHGQTVWSSEGRYASSTDLDLWQEVGLTPPEYLS